MKFLDAKRNRAAISDKMDRAPVSDKSNPSSSEKAPAGSGHPAKDREPNATQAAIRLANDSGIDLANIQGTGIEGRITVGDVQAAIDASKPKDPETDPNTNTES